MGKVIRIEDDSIRSMRKTLDDLPDKRLGKTRDEATEMLFAIFIGSIQTVQKGMMN